MRRLQMKSINIFSIDINFSFMKKLLFQMRYQ